MLESVFASSNYQASKVMLDMSALRHKVMAGNLANVETPGYKRLDIDPSFRAELNASVRSRDIRAILGAGEPTIVPEKGLKAVRMDGNTVSLDREIMEINHNAMEYQAMAQFVSSSLSRLKMAISGRVD